LPFFCEFFVSLISQPYKNIVTRSE
jgi:hypothetical protein